MEAMKEIWYVAGDEYEESCRPLFLTAIKAFADAVCESTRGPGLHIVSDFDKARHAAHAHAVCIARLEARVFGEGR